jgi:hypothetical protein
VVSTAVERFDIWDAQAGKPMLEFFEILAGKHIIFLPLGTPRHDDADSSIFAISSPRHFRSMRSHGRQLISSPPSLTR